MFHMSICSICKRAGNHRTAKRDYFPSVAAKQRALYHLSLAQTSWSSVFKDHPRSQCTSSSTLLQIPYFHHTHTSMSSSGSMSLDAALPRPVSHANVFADGAGCARRWILREIGGTRFLWAALLSRACSCRFPSHNPKSQQSFRDAEHIPQCSASTSAGCDEWGGLVRDFL